MPNNLESKPHISPDFLTTTAKYKVSCSLSFKYCSSNPPLKLLKISILSPFFNNLWNHFYSQSGLRSPFHFFSLQTTSQHKHCFNQTVLQTQKWFEFPIFMPLNLWISKNISSFIRQNHGYFKIYIKPPFKILTYISLAR